MGAESANSPAANSPKRTFCGWRPMAEQDIRMNNPERIDVASASPERFSFRIVRISALRNSMLLIVLGGVWLALYVATNGTFLTQRNLVLLALQTSIVSLAAISAVMLIVTRNFDLSVGSAVA